MSLDDLALQFQAQELLESIAEYEHLPCNDPVYCGFRVAKMKHVPPGSQFITGTEISRRIPNPGGKVHLPFVGINNALSFTLRKFVEPLLPGGDP